MTGKKTNVIDKELDKMGKHLDEFESQVKELTLDRMNEAKLETQEPQTKLSSKELGNSKDIYLKPARSISVAHTEKFNENYREQYNFAKEYVHFIAEHKEVIGETIEAWTKPFQGIPAEFWQIPVNKPVWGPRYLAEQLRKCNYHRLVMEERYAPDNMVGQSGLGAMYGKMVVESKIQRLTAEPVFSHKSIFMGAA
jgi:hypothetical protein